MASFRLGDTYQAVADKLLKPPLNTAELMALIAYAHEVETVTLYDLEDELRIVMSYIIFLSDYVLLSAAEIKQNSYTFIWYNKMPSIIDKNHDLVNKKTIEFQTLLQVCRFV